MNTGYENTQLPEDLVPVYDRIDELIDIEIENNGNLPEALNNEFNMLIDYISE